MKMIKIFAIAAAIPVAAMTWALGFLGFSFAWQTAGSLTYLAGTTLFGIAVMGWPSLLGEPKA